jgi:hypothetical protein
MSQPSLLRPPVVIEGAVFGPPPVLLPKAQVELLVGAGGILVDSKNRTAEAAGIVFEESGRITINNSGQFFVKRCEAAAGRKTLRTAQYICGISGLLMVNAIMLYDAQHRGDNIKDFLINFSSDILAVGAILLASEIVDRISTTDAVDIRSRPFDAVTDEA